MNRRKREQLQQKQAFLQGCFVVGIDPSKKKLQGQITDGMGTPIGSSFTITATREGFHRMHSKQIAERLPQLSPEQFSFRLVFAVETSCNLWQKIVHHLTEQHYRVVLVNPLATYHGRPSLSGDFSSNDPKDAHIIARVAAQGNFYPLRESNERSRAMQRLSITYLKLRKTLQQNKLRLRSQVEMNFPEFFDYLEFDSATSMYLLRHYVVLSDFLEIDIEREAAQVKKVSAGQHGHELLERLVAAARSSFGIKRFDEEIAAERTITFALVSAIEGIERGIRDVEDQLVRYSKKTRHHQVITSLKGIGDLLAALFIAELIDPGAFSHYKQIERMAGYHLHVVQSGTYCGQRKISRLGNRRLRCILYLMVVQTTRYVPEIRMKYLRRQLNGHRSRKENLVACVPKLLELLVALIREDHFYKRSEQSIDMVADLERELKRVRSRRKRQGSRGVLKAVA